MGFWLLYAETRVAVTSESGPGALESEEARAKGGDCFIGVVTERFTTYVGESLSHQLG